MLVNTFLVLGCVAFLIVIARAIPERMQAALVAFGLVGWQVGTAWDTEAGLIAGGIASLVVFLLLLKYGTHNERKAARKAREDRQELMREVRQAVRSTSTP